jgi:hypothetical protein
MERRFSDNSISTIASSRDPRRILETFLDADPASAIRLSMALCLTDDFRCHSGLLVCAKSTQTGGIQDLLSKLAASSPDMGLTPQAEFVCNECHFTVNLGIEYFEQRIAAGTLYVFPTPGSAQYKWVEKAQAQIAAIDNGVNDYEYL